MKKILILTVAIFYSTFLASQTYKLDHDVSGRLIMSNDSLTTEEKYRQRLNLMSNEIYIVVENDSLKFIEAGKRPKVNSDHLDSIQIVSIIKDTIELYKLGFTITNDQKDLDTIDEIEKEYDKLLKKQTRLKLVLDSMIVFENTLYELDTIQAGAIIDTVYTFTNKSDSTFIIDKLKSNCSCMVSKNITKAYPPGKVGQINLVFDSTDKHTGETNQCIEIFNNFTEDPIKIYLKAFVNNDEKKQSEVSRLTSLFDPFRIDTISKFELDKKIAEYNKELKGISNLYSFSDKEVSEVSYTYFHSYEVDTISTDLYGVTVNREEYLKSKRMMLELFSIKDKKKVNKKADGNFYNKGLKEFPNIENQDLTRLNFYKNELTSLPPSIKSFKKLKILTVDYNKLDSIPDEIGELNSLVELSFTYNQIRYVSDSIGKLSNLKSLNLSDNNIKEIPKSIWNLQLLEQLYLSDNELTTIPNSIANLSGLTHFSADDNELDNFPVGLENLKKLKSLNLGGNKIMQIPESIKNFESLSYIDFSDSRLKELPIELFQIATLKDLILDEISISSLPSGDFKIDSLEDIRLTNNRLDTLPEQLFQIESLRIVNLSGNYLKHIPENISQAVNLESLYISSNNLDVIDNDFKFPENLITLNLQGNRIVKIPESIGTLGNLEYLDLSRNVINKIPNTINDLKSLGSLNLIFNEIEDLPEDLSNLNNLRTLSLYSNSLRKFPKGILTIPNLYDLDLSGNNIGEIPDNIEKLKSLRYLKLSKNEFILKVIDELRLKLPECDITLIDNK